MRGSDELGAGQVEIALARAFLGRRRQRPSSSSVLQKLAGVQGAGERLGDDPLPRRGLQ